RGGADRGGRHCDQSRGYAGWRLIVFVRPPESRRQFVFFFKQKTAYEIGLGIPAEPLFRSSRRFGGATCDDKSAQIYARFDKNDWRIQPAEFYRFHDAEVNTFGYF